VSEVFQKGLSDATIVGEADAESTEERKILLINRICSLPVPRVVNQTFTKFKAGYFVGQVDPRNRLDVVQIRVVVRRLRVAVGLGEIQTDALGHPR